ncbi:MAG TPA: universal stress protein [Thermomicrobiales bacterium]|jgi:nucleotide-binding universal stress UspA family protein
MHQRGSFYLVLVADGTPATDAAARTVRDLIDPGAIGRVSVVAVGSPVTLGNQWFVGMLGFVGVVPQALVDDLWERARAWAGAEAARVIRLLGEVAPMAVPVVRVGNPVEEVVAVTREWDADLVVIGSERREGMRHAARRDVAAEVMRAATCPVLIVRADGGEPPVSGKRVPVVPWRLAKGAAVPVAAGVGA